MEARLPDFERWLTLTDVLNVTNLARSTIYDLIREADFPRQVKIGSASRWAESDVLDWMARKHAERPKSRAA
jgi:prophage regulatory protein